MGVNGIQNSSYSTSPMMGIKTCAHPQVLLTAREKAENYIPLTWVTGTVQECELSKQPGEVSQGPANLFTFLSTRKQKKGRLVPA